MLVLTRRLGETICIGNDVLVRVVAVQGQKVRIGVEAPDHVRVDREEIRRRIEAFDHEAAAESVGVGALE